MHEFEDASHATAEWRCLGRVLRAEC